ncbi:MAG: hypothetical protein ACTHK4_10300 [Mycobacteriales bacterium]
MVRPQPSTRLRLAALGAAATVTWLSFDGPIGPASASATAAPVTAWWTTANLGSGVAVPGALLGASGKELAVEGSNALPPVSAVSKAPLSSIAVTAIRWRLHAGEVPASLSLAIAGSPPPFVTVQACQVTASFGSVYGGPYADVPSYSCAHAVDGVAKGAQLTFPGIGKLASGRTLSVLLLPGPLDHVVFAPPSASSLVVKPASVPRPPPAGCACPGVASGGPKGGGNGVGSATVSGPLPSISAAPPQVGPAPSAPAPVVAGSTNGTTQAAALSKALPRWRRWLAAGVIALEVLVFAATRRSSGKGEDPGRGIGRFIAQRETSPIRL